ncbi:hypothetical protein Bpfe_024517 [Biomphalaria pfeifferi]|uniref:Asteroid domain-containing protein n=1 Tax=Biomphalaria pfeifferi TaxID=112525 RepID=A0AAD8F0N5_BIOPF|nr:hypothetical protein Bpfe_024517 [Biomphalaria pfeifferi]
MKCKVVFHVSGEADVIIGKSIRSNEQAFILSNDTDFAIFPEINFLPIEFFDVNGQIGLGLSSFEPKVPENIVCGMVCADDITKLFKLPNRESLIEVATIAGNDVTRPVLIKYKEYREVYMARLFRISEQIKKNKAIENCDFFGLLMSKSDEFNQAVRHSRQFYALQVPEEDEPQDGSSLQIIFSNIRQGKFPSTILSMYRGKYWRRQILEDPAEGMPVAEEVMSEIRSYLYKLVLPLESEFVTEIGRTMTNNFTETQVTKISDDQFPSLEELQNNSISSKLNLFEKILSHKDSFDLHEGQSHLKVFGTKKGFTFLILRYFLSLNWNLNLCLTSREVYALIAWTAVEHNAFEYLKFNILPSSRCLTLQSWVQNLYRIVYAFLGNVLGISDEFPPPKELFTASAWVVLYTSCSSEKLVCPKHVAIEEMQKAHQCVVKTIQENEDLVKKIIDGFFSFDLTELKATDWAYHK